MFALIYVEMCFCKKFKKTDQVFGTKTGQLYKLYKQGKEKIDRDLNIINVLNRLRFFQVSLLGNLKEEDYWKTFYNDYNVIDLDNKYFSTTDEEDDKNNIAAS